MVEVLVKVVEVLVKVVEVVHAFDPLTLSSSWLAKQFLSWGRGGGS